MRINETEDDLLWGPYYESVLNVLGTTGLIIPLGDTPLHEPAARTTVVTVGEEQATFTYSKSVATFDAPPTPMGPGRIPLVTFDGTDEEADSPDAGFWSPNGKQGPSTTDLAFSLGLWINPAAADDDTLIAKWDETATTREWMYALSGASKPEFSLYDENAGDASEIGEATTAVTLNAMQFVVVTYDGAQATPGVTFYLDGAADGTGTTETNAYIAMQDKVSTVTLAMNKDNGTAGDFYTGKMAGGPLGPFFVLAELSADQVKRLYQLGRRALGV